MMDEHVFDLLSGYALGILEEDEWMLVTRHIAHCDVCQRELATYAEISAQLANMTIQPNSPPTLKAKVLQQAQQASESTYPTVEKLSLRQVLRNLFRQPVALTLGVVSVLVILFLAASNLLLWQRMNQIQAHTPGEYMQVVQLQGTDLAPETSGYVMVFKGQNYGSLAVIHAPLLGEDQQYQIWLIQDGIRTSGGVFSVNEDGYGNLMVSASQTLDSFDAFGITIEPQGGSPQPTGEKILGGEL